MTPDDFQTSLHNVTLKKRPRWKRMLCWPLMVFRHWRIGGGIRVALLFANAGLKDKPDHPTQ